MSTLVTTNAGANTNIPVRNRPGTSNRVNLGLTVVVSAFAVAAYVAQLRGNWLGSIANKIAQKTYKEQVWKDCHDRTVRSPKPHELSPLNCIVGRAEFHDLAIEVDCSSRFARREFRLAIFLGEPANPRYSICRSHREVSILAFQKAADTAL
jgi:hypothetical protein